MSSAKRSKLLYKVCLHCNKDLNIRTYKDHKRLYYNEESNCWYHTTDALRDECDESSSDISPPPSPIQVPSTKSSNSDFEIQEDPMEAQPSPITLPHDIDGPHHLHQYGTSFGQLKGLVFK